MKLEDLDAAPPARLPFPVTRAASSAIECRTEGDGPLTMVGHFSTFNDWYEVNSHIEGHFKERIAPGAFRKTIGESRAQMKVLFNHGQDTSIGEQILGSIDELREDNIGPAYAVPLFDGVPALVVSGLRANAYGSSHRFSAVNDVWDYQPTRSAHNPDGIPERTITEARVFEFGPVTFPADPKATAGIRSTTDDFYKRSRDPEALETLLRSAQVARTSVRTEAAETPPEPPPATQETEPAGADTPEAPPDPPPSEAPSETPEDPPEGGSPDSEESNVPSTTPEPAATVSRTERPARMTEVRAALDGIVNEHDGVLPQEVQTRWDDLTAELVSLERADKADTERRAFTAERAAHEPTTESERSWTPKSFNTPRERVRDIYSLAEIRSASTSPEDERQLLRDSAMRSVETSTFPHPNVEQNDARGQVQRLLDHKDSENKELAIRILQTGNPAYQRAFNKLVAGRSLTPEEQRAAALAVVGTTTTGGYAVPYVFDPTIIHTGAYTNINPFRVICRVEQIVGGNVWRGVSAGAITAQYRAEGAAMTEGGPTFALPTYTAQRADAFVTLSRETLQDRPDIASELSTIIDEGKATLEENQFSIGVGTTVYPSGMFVKSKFTPKETITNDTFAVADLDATEADLPIRHRRDAVWMYSRAVIRIIQGWETAYGKLFNSTLGYPAVGNPENNPGGNTGLSLLGYPVWETPSAPVTVTTDDTIVGILVSPKNYIIVDRVGMEVEIVPNLFDATTGFPTGQRGLLAIWRNTAGPVNADAGRQVNIN